MMYLSIVALVTVFFTFTLAFHNVPVFLLDEGQLDGIIESELDPFAEITHDTFARFMNSADTVAPTLIFFIETELNLMDVTSKDIKGTAFPHSRKKLSNNKMKMLLQVEAPYVYIKARYPEHDFNKFFLSGTVANIRFGERYKYMYFMFEDNVNETRVQQLRRHDSLMHQVYFALKQLTKAPLVAIYTGKSSQHISDAPGPKNELHLSSTSDSTPTTTQTPNQIKFLCKNASFVLYGVVQLHKAGRMPPLEPDVCNYLDVKNDRWAYDLRLKCHLPGETISYNVQFVFVYQDPNDKYKGWKAEEVIYTTEGIKLQSQPLDLLGNWSTWYVSTTPLTLNTPPGNFLPKLLIKKYAILLGEQWPMKTTLTATEPTLPPLWMEEQGFQDRSMPWSILGGHNPQGGGLKSKQNMPVNMETELFALRTNKEALRAQQTEKLASVAILMGLVVVFIMATVFFYGLSMIMGINTNSKYDSMDTKPFFDPDSGKD